MPPAGETQRKLDVEALRAAAGSKAVASSDEASVLPESLETSAASSSEACDASGHPAAALNCEEPIGGAGQTADVAPEHHATTGKGASSVGCPIPKSHAQGVVFDEAIDHERFTQLAKQQPGWAPTHEGPAHAAHNGSQDQRLTTSVSDLAQVTAGLQTFLRLLRVLARATPLTLCPLVHALPPGCKTKSSVSIDPWTGEARKLRAETKKPADSKKVGLQDKGVVLSGVRGDVSLVCARLITACVRGRCAWLLACVLAAHCGCPVSSCSLVLLIFCLEGVFCLKRVRSGGGGCRASV